jgi:general secretion pathway protein M
MSTGPISLLFRRHRSIALLSYVVAVTALVAVTEVSLAELYDRYVAVRSASELLKQLEGRSLARRTPPAPGVPAPEGSPFLEGWTVTVAGAALLQRVSGAVTRAGGSVLSSQVDVNSTPARPNFVNLTISCELDRQTLGALLYDLEAGMPFIFIDQLVVQAPQQAGQADAGRLRVMLAVSGQWQAARP